MYRGFQYQKNKHTPDKIHWRCWKSGCHAPIHTNIFDVNNTDPVINVLYVGRHDHPKDHEVIRSNQIITRLQDAVVSDPTRPISRTYRHVLRHMDVDEEAIPQFHNVRSTLQRARAALLPPIPHEIDEVVIEGDWCNTWTGHRFLSHQDNDCGILIFATANNYRRLARCDTI